MPLKDNNEITVKLNATKQQMLNLLIEKGFEGRDWNFSL